jgi:hypothetical protein
MSVYRFASQNAKGTTTYSALLEDLTPEQVDARLAYKRRAFPDWTHEAEEVNVAPRRRLVLAGRP